MAYGVVTIGSVNFGNTAITQQNGNVAIKKNEAYQQIISLDENTESGVLSWNPTLKAAEVVQIGGDGGIVSNTVNANDNKSVASSAVYYYVNSSGYIDSALKSETADTYFTSAGYQQLVSSGIVQEALNDEDTVDGIFQSLLSDLQSEQYMLQTVSSGSGQHTVSSSGIYEAIHNKIEFTQGIIIHSSREISLVNTTLNVDMSNTSYLTAKLEYDITNSVGNVDSITIENMSSGSTFVIAVEIIGTGTNTLSFDFPNMTASVYDGTTTSQITKFKKTQNTAISMASGEIMLLSGIMIQDILFMTINDNAAWY